MKTRHGRSLALVIMLALGACTSGSEAVEAPGSSAPTSSDADTTAPSETVPGPKVQDIMSSSPSLRSSPGPTSSTPTSTPPPRSAWCTRSPLEGWAAWIGAAKPADDGHVMVSITTVTNLVSHGCRDHSWADPPVGPSVDDLAAALADLAPFRVTSPPKDVTIYGYRGKHLELTVPDLPVKGEGDDRRFTGCAEGTLKSWVAAVDTEPGDAFYGYNASPAAPRSSGSWTSTAPA